jgi:hypothetical protein
MGSLLDPGQVMKDVHDSSNNALKVNIVASTTSSPYDSAATATLSNVASSATNVTLLASNTSRKAAYIYNDSTEILYVKFGTTASSSSYTVQLGVGEYYELPAYPIYTGIIDGIWASANGSARITELT